MDVYRKKLPVCYCIYYDKSKLCVWYAGCNSLLPRRGFCHKVDRCFFNNDRLFLNSKIKMKVKFATIFMLWITVLPLFAQKSSDAQIIHTISKAASAVTSMKCSFVHTKHMRLLNEKMVSKGKMYYQKSDKLRWEYVSPYNYTFILNGSNVLLKNKKRNDVIDVNQNKLFKEIAQIMMSSVVGHNLSDDKSFKTKISETSVEYVASMVPLRKNMKQMFKTIVIHFNKKKKYVTKVELLENNGDQTIIELQNISINEAISASLFSIR